tara:strand:- start:403 stop:1260 length:858 start_codon:yes stop_codon:yes gene_type:complete
MKYKRHSKVKNTGLIFELLTRQIVADSLNNKNSHAVKILKNYFKKGTELFKEYQIYQCFLNQKYNDERKADKLIDLVLEQVGSVNEKSIKKEKYNLVKEVIQHYDLKDFSSGRITNYKVQASIYKLMEHYRNNQNVEPSEVVDSRFTLIEHLTSGKTKKNRDNEIKKLVEKQDKDVRYLTIKTLLEKFNEKYSSLDDKQRKLLSTYIYNVTNTNSLSEYVYNEFLSIKKDMNTLIKRVDDDVTKIKLKEVIKQIPSKTQTKSMVRDKQVSSLLRHYELVKELKKL